MNLLLLFLWNSRCNIFFQDSDGDYLLDANVRDVDDRSQLFDNVTRESFFYTMQQETNGK